MMRDDFQKMIGRGFSFLQIISFQMPACKVKIIFGKTPDIKKDFYKKNSNWEVKYNFGEVWQSSLGLWSLHSQGHLLLPLDIDHKKGRLHQFYFVNGWALSQKKLTSIW